MIQAFPKIFAIDTDYIRDIFSGPVEISEKVDGSQFGFGKVGGELVIRSKGARMYTANPEKMFAEGIAYVESISHLLPEGIIFYGEYLKKPKHNTLAYQRIPNNHIMLFGAMDISAQTFDPGFHLWADTFGLEVVPKWEVTISSANDLRHYLDRESVLGGCKVEGVVVKNYSRPFLLGGQPIPVMAGKFVSESFKEVHRNRWGSEEKGSSKWATFCGSFNTTSRWEKSVQHLAENGAISHTPKDIGALLKEIHTDIEAEEKEAIKEYLWQENKREIFAAAVRGLPEWYKQRLLDSAFSQE